jgi:hypothetical protein
LHRWFWVEPPAGGICFPKLGVSGVAQSNPRRGGGAVFLFCWLCFLFFFVAAFAFVSWRGVFLFCCDSPAIWVGLFVPSWTVRPTFDLGGAFAENGKGKGARARGLLKNRNIRGTKKAGAGGGGGICIFPKQKKVRPLISRIFGVCSAGVSLAPGRAARRVRRGSCKSPPTVRGTRALSGGRCCVVFM